MAESLQIVTLKDVQLFKDSDGAAARRLCVYRASALGCADWRDPLCLISPEVISGEHSTIVMKKRRYALRDVTFIKVVTAMFGNTLQSPG